LGNEFIALTIKQYDGTFINFKIKECYENNKRTYDLFDQKYYSIDEIIAMFISPLVVISENVQPLNIKSRVGEML